MSMGKKKKFLGNWNCLFNMSENVNFLLRSCQKKKYNPPIFLDFWYTNVQTDEFPFSLATSN